MVNGWLCCTSQPKVRSPSHEEPTTSSPPPFIDSMRLIIHQLQLVPPTDQIDPLITFIDYLLPRIKASPKEESAFSSSLDSGASHTNLAGEFIKKIATEALKSKDLVKEMGKLALSGLVMAGEANWVFLGLAVAAYALERCVTVSSNVSDCIELLQKIAFLAKDLKKFKELMPEENDRLCVAVQIIVEGAVMCCDYMSKGTISRFGTLNPFIYAE